MPTKQLLSYSFFQSATIAVGILLQNLIAAWYLSPSDFGIWATLMLLYRLCTPIVEGGWSRAMISQKDLAKNQLQTLFTYNIGLSIVVSLLLCLSANLLSKFFNINELAIYVYTLSLIFLPIGVGAISRTLLQKSLNFKRLAQSQIIASIIEFFLFLILLHFGFKVWALVLPFVLKMFLLNLIYWFSEKIEIAFKNDFSSVKSILIFGNYDLGAQMLNYFYSNLDNLFIAHFLGQAALGLYSLAWDLTVKPVSFINPIISRVYFPLMTKVENLTPLYRKGMTILMAIQMPIYAILVVTIYPILHFFYGEQWSVATVAAQWLCGVALLRALSELGASVLVVRGRVAVEFYFQVFNTIITLLSLCAIFYLEKTIENVAIAMFFAHVLIILCWHFVVWKIGKVAYKDILLRFFVLLLFLGFVILLFLYPL
jgi:O-antigen/teichoic acid export membrane protein